MLASTRWLRRGLFTLLLTACALLLVEGLCSVAAVVFSIADPSPPPRAASGHTRPDPLLGWVSRPGAVVRNLYGLGGHVRINAQGLRSDREFSVDVPPGKVRIVCSGDSFTFGHGVSNEQTWCQQLERLDERLEAVNMGQGAYGLDQSYLWYRRDGVRLEHDVHLFAFITEDVLRMQRDEFNGYGKPVLRVRQGKLVVENVPVPGTDDASGSRPPRAPSRFDQLRTVSLLRALVAGLAPAGWRQRAAQVLDEAETRQVVAKLIESLHEVHRDRGSVLVLVHLPIENELHSGWPWSDWSALFATEAARHGLLLVDVLDEMRKLPPVEIRKLFLLGRGGHYSRRGHALVARALRRELLAFPPVAGKLAVARAPGP